MAVVFAVPIGLISLRTRRLAFLIVTIAFSELINLIATSASGLTGGEQGISVFGFPPGIHSSTSMYFVFMAILLAVAVGFRLLRSTPLASQVIAARDNEELARSIGIKVHGLQLALFVITGAVIGLAGPMLLYQQQAINPDLFTSSQFLVFYLIIVLGGISTLTGPLIGAWIVVFLPDWTGSLIADPNSQQLAYAVAVLALVLFAPSGLVGGASQLVRSRSARRVDDAAPSPDLPAEVVTEQRRRRPTSSTSLSGNELLVASGITHRFGAKVALDRVDITVYTGEIRGLIGPNGSGKTTLLNCVSGFLYPTSGTIAFDGRVISGRSAEWRARNGLVRTFQQPSAFASMSVRESCELSLSVRKAQSAVNGERTERSALADVDEVLSWCKLESRAADLASSLGYGDLRLLTVAIGLAARPRLLLLDEPSAGLARADSERLGDFLERARGSGTSLLVVSHEMDFLLSVCNSLTVLDAGSKVVEGDPESVCRDERVITAYLGQEIPESRREDHLSEN
jgi:ABC-type branched-subunit amino acid transport system ATPase component/branched-subunit amino acid ABC-type transport system permease component